MRLFLEVGCLPGKQLRKLMLLGRNLKQQALAQVARAHAGRVKLLHQFDSPPQPVKVQ